MEKIDDNQCSSAKFSMKPVVLSEDQGSRDANSANNEHVLKAKKLKLDEKGVCINALKNVEEALRRSNKLEVEARNQMLAVSKMLRQINTKEAEKRRKEANKHLFYKGKDLLAYDGARDDYAGFGRYLSRCILSKEERMKTCWFAQRMTIKGRVNASIEDEKFFRDAVKMFRGDNLYALRRVKDAANALGVRERASLSSGVSDNN
ncbi:uncharacterized protein LOC142356386 [Convolutriloba macropyga]|uniref:uncharacterized protein LOC142356386 n=1 Tax=Convolutriloba macropyga TaxID=536237 RepID=UPI003F524DF7